MSHITTSYHSLASLPLLMSLINFLFMICNFKIFFFQLMQAGKTVILVFSIQHSGNFQGYGRLAGDTPVTGDIPLDMSGNHSLSTPLPIQWIKRANIPYHATRHLFNPYNDYAKVQTSRDGQVGFSLITGRTFFLIEHLSILAQPTLRFTEKFNLTVSHFLALNSIRNIFIYAKNNYNIRLQGEDVMGQCLAARPSNL